MVPLYGTPTSPAERLAESLGCALFPEATAELAAVQAVNKDIQSSKGARPKNAEGLNCCQFRAGGSASDFILSYLELGGVQEDAPDSERP